MLSIARGFNSVEASLNAWNIREKKSCCASCQVVERFFFAHGGSNEELALEWCQHLKLLSLSILPCIKSFEIFPGLESSTYEWNLEVGWSKIQRNSSKPAVKWLRSYELSISQPVYGLSRWFWTVHFFGAKPATTEFKWLSLGSSDQFQFRFLHCSCTVPTFFSKFLLRLVEISVIWMLDSFGRTPVC